MGVNPEGQGVIPGRFKKKKIWDTDTRADGHTDVTAEIRPINYLKSETVLQKPSSSYDYKCVFKAAPAKRSLLKIAFFCCCCSPFVQKITLIAFSSLPFEIC